MAKGWLTVEDYFNDPQGYAAHRRPYVAPSSKEQQIEEQQGPRPTGTEILAYARNVYGKPWRMDADTALAIEEYLETGDIPHRAQFLLAQLIDDIVSILTWRATGRPAR